MIQSALQRGALFPSTRKCCALPTSHSLDNTLILAKKEQLAHGQQIMGNQRPTTIVIGEAGHL
jgi:hypothetical protein